MLIPLIITSFVVAMSLLTCRSMSLQFTARVTRCRCNSLHVLLDQTSVHGETPSQSCQGRGSVRCCENAGGVAIAAFVISNLLFTSRICEHCLWRLFCELLSREVPVVDHRSYGGVSHSEPERCCLEFEQS